MLKEIPSSPTSPLLNRCVTSFTSSVRMMLRSSSMIRSEKLHRRNCPMSIRMVSPSLSGAVVRTGVSPTMNRTIGFDHLQLAHPLIVIAKNLQQHVAAGAGGEQNIVGFEPARDRWRPDIRIWKPSVGTGRPTREPAGADRLNPSRCRCGK